MHAHGKERERGERREKEEHDSPAPAQVAPPSDCHDLGDIPPALRKLSRPLGKALETPRWPWESD